MRGVVMNGVRCWVALMVFLTPAALAGQTNDAVEQVRVLRLSGSLESAERLAEERLSESGVSVEEQVALHIELAFIHDRYGLHRNTRPVPAAMQHVEMGARIAPASSGAAAAAFSALTAWLRAAMTASRVSRSCFIYPLAVSTRFGMRS